MLDKFPTKDFVWAVDENWLKFTKYKKYTITLQIFYYFPQIIELKSLSLSYRPLSLSLLMPPTVRPSLRSSVPRLRRYALDIDFLTIFNVFHRHIICVNSLLIVSSGNFLGF